MIFSAHFAQPSRFPAARGAAPASLLLALRLLP